MTADSLIEKSRGDGIVSSDVHVSMDGMSVFSFAISKAPKSIKSLLEKTGDFRCWNNIQGTVIGWGEKTIHWDATALLRMSLGQWCISCPMPLAGSLVIILLLMVG